MNQRKKSLIALLLVFSLLLSSTPVSAYTKLRIKNIRQNPYTMTIGTTYPIKTNYSSRKLSFTSSNKKIVSVSKNGKLTARKAGTCKIRIYVKGYRKQSKTIRVQVIDTIKIQNNSKLKKTFLTGDSIKIKTNYATNGLRFKSSNPKVATVSKSGTIKMKKAGTCKITLVSKFNKKRTKTITIKIKNRPKPIIKPIPVVKPKPTKMPLKPTTPPPSPTNSPIVIPTKQPTLAPSKQPIPTESFIPTFVSINDAQKEIEATLESNGIKNNAKNIAELYKQGIITKEVYDETYPAKDLSWFECGYYLSGGTNKDAIQGFLSNYSGASYYYLEYLRTEANNTYIFKCYIA